MFNVKLTQEHIVLIALSFLNQGAGRGRNMYPVALLFTSVVSILNALEPAHIFVPGLTALAAALPGYETGLGWILPALAGMAVGFLTGVKEKPFGVQEKKRREQG